MRSAQSRNAEYERRKAKCIQFNLCLRCQQPKGENTSLCSDCLDKKNKTRRERSKTRSSQGLCACGKTPISPHRTCEECQKSKRADIQKRRLEFRSRGLCFCGSEPEINKTTCFKCDVKATKSTLLRYYNNIEAELCAFCGSGLDISTFRCNTCNSNHAERSRIYWREKRLSVINHYGSKCQCCGEGTFEFLDIDHVNNNGKQHRLITGQHFCKWVMTNKFPDDLQILCSNCNHGKAKFGICPHVQEIRPATTKNSQKNRRKRMKVIDQYGGACKCCGESNWGFLEFDHVNNDGNVHREITKNIMDWAIKNSYPDIIQLLCSNCNKAKGLYGCCPHTTMAFGDKTERHRSTCESHLSIFVPQNELLLDQSENAR